MAPAILESLLGRNERAVCRICQSETGIMIRPCACAGTMADIHENCLNEWVSRSKAEKCEICKESYAQAKRFRPIREWTKPEITFRLCLMVASYICAYLSILNILSICAERKFFDRVFVRGYPPRGADWVRIVIAAILLIMDSCIFSILFDKIVGYFARQRVLRFIDNPNQSAK